MSSLDDFAAALGQVLERCVWSQGMTHASLVPYLIEESYELVEAIEAGTVEDLVEELGDVLWQVGFHAAIGARTRGEDFDIQLVAARVTEKMVRRHPHVFGDEVATTPEEVLRLWTAAKAAEKRDRRSVLDGVPLGMPALALADTVVARAARVGVRVTAAPVPVPADEAALGEGLLALVLAARERGLDPERALRTRLRAVRAEIATAESAAGAAEIAEAEPVAGEVTGSEDVPGSG